MNRILNPYLLTAVLLAATGAAPSAKQDDAERTAPGTRYFMCVFAFESEARTARTSHTFATFVKYDGKAAEAHTISWWPRSNSVRLVRLVGEPGVNLTLRETLDLAAELQTRVHEWGPYEIKQELYEKAVRQIARLNNSEAAFKALDGRSRPNATNCIHAVSDIDTDQGSLQTGTSFGAEASAMVVEHLRKWIIMPEKLHPSIDEELGLKKETTIRRQR